MKINLLILLILLSLLTLPALPALPALISINPYSSEYAMRTITHNAHKSFNASYDAALREQTERCIHTHLLTYLSFQAHKTHTSAYPRTHSHRGEILPWITESDAIAVREEMREDKAREEEGANDVAKNIAASGESAVTNEIEAAGVCLCARTTPLLEGGPPPSRRHTHRHPGAHTDLPAHTQTPINRHQLVTNKNLGAVCWATI
jgi:hypothetical protein